jgi:transposase-like protein
MEAIKERGKREVPVIEVDEQQLRAHVSEVVRESVEQTLNGLLEAEADTLCQARRYERNAQWAGTGAGHYERSFQTRAGTVQLKMPKLRQVAFETVIIERYRRRESAVEEALVEISGRECPYGVWKISPKRCGVPAKRIWRCRWAWP